MHSTRCELKPQLLNSGHFEFDLVLLNGETGEGKSEKCLSGVIDREVHMLLGA
jgi:hypothetical protein